MASKKKGKVNCEIHDKQMLLNFKVPFGRKDKEKTLTFKLEQEEVTLEDLAVILRKANN
jgi:hypothetical protein